WRDEFAVCRRPLHGRRPALDRHVGLRPRVCVRGVRWPRLVERPYPGAVERDVDHVGALEQPWIAERRIAMEWPVRYRRERRRDGQFVGHRRRHSHRRLHPPLRHDDGPGSRLQRRSIDERRYSRNLDERIWRKRGWEFAAEYHRVI